MSIRWWHALGPWCSCSQLEENVCVLLLAVLNLNENLTDCKSPSDKREKLCLKFYFFLNVCCYRDTQLHPSHTSVTVWRLPVWWGPSVLQGWNQTHRASVIGFKLNSPKAILFLSIYQPTSYFRNDWLLLLVISG